MKMHVRTEGELKWACERVEESEEKVYEIIFPDGGTWEEAFKVVAAALVGKQKMQMGV
jgi:hypothetical protein